MIRNRTFGHVTSSLQCHQSGNSRTHHSHWTLETSVCYCLGHKNMQMYPFDWCCITVYQFTSCMRMHMEGSRNVSALSWTVIRRWLPWDTLWSLSVKAEGNPPFGKTRTKQLCWFHSAKSCVALANCLVILTYHIWATKKLWWWEMKQQKWPERQRLTSVSGCTTGYGVTTTDLKITLFLDQWSQQVVQVPQLCLSVRPRLIELCPLFWSTRKALSPNYRQSAIWFEVKLFVSVVQQSDEINDTFHV